MTALADIAKALNSMPPVEPGKQRFVIVAPSAMKALQCETKNNAKPLFIGNKSERYDIIETDQTDDFLGWDIVDRTVQTGRRNRA